MALIRKGQLAKELNIPWPTVKYYTSVGLFSVAGRTPNGQHLYHLPTVREKYERIKTLKRQRLTIEEIIDRLKIESIVQETSAV